MERFSKKCLLVWKCKREIFPDDRFWRTVFDGKSTQEEEPAGFWQDFPTTESRDDN